MDNLISLMLLIIGIIHLMPVTGVLGNQQLAKLYGMDFSEPDLSILMRHRAVLFGLLGSFMVFAALNPPYRTLAFFAATVSIISFLWLARSVGNYGVGVSRVFKADIVALICLVIGVAAHLHVQNSGIGYP